MHLKNLLFVLLATTAMPSWAQSNIAYKDGQVRFTVITDGVVRMEYDPQGQFTDDKSLIAVNRQYAPVKYQLRKSGNHLRLSTARMVVSYKLGSGAFTASNLSITSAKGAKVAFHWKPGMKDTQNLKGTYRTLDETDGDSVHGKPIPIEDGLLSRSGWTFIDDSQGYVFDHSDWPWVTHRKNEGRGQDFYFMAYGHDYKKALGDFTLFSGKIPLPPRYAFGYWWSRYWSYSDNELRSLVDNFHSHDIPLDVLVVDMDWHYTEPGKGGWTGYTWNRRLFPDPSGFLKWVGDEQLKVTLNLHPASGIKYYEEHYPEMARWMGLDPAQKKDIPWAASDKKFMTGWFNTQLRPMEKAGVSFWWLDWQQGLMDKVFPRLGNTWWLNYTVFTDMERNRPERPMLYHRWGGLGNHRYQIGFSGDSKISWKCLDYQPYFNSTASNVLYGYWSHDIGGHNRADHIDPEMYIRWMQFGALSPILRTHSTKDGRLNKEPWVFNNTDFTILRNIVLGRYTLAPYIYTMARKTYDTGISLCRPMYYDYPEREEAYSNRNEYMFGDNLLVYPITAPAKDGLSTKTVWLPAGNDWYEVSSGTLLKGGQNATRTFHLDEFPLYVKAGSVLPLYGKVKNLKSNTDSVFVTVFPGDKGSFTWYEDNGDDKNYATQYATTELNQHRSANTLEVKIGARKGNYVGMPASRQLWLKVVASAVPQQVTVNGQEVKWQYDGNELALLVRIPDTRCDVEKTVKVVYPDAQQTAADGTIGAFRRIQQNVVTLKYRKSYIVLNEALGTMESTGRALTYHPEEYARRMSTFRTNYEHLSDVLKEQKLDDKEIGWFMRMTK